MSQHLTPLAVPLDGSPFMTPSPLQPPSVKEESSDSEEKPSLSPSPAYSPSPSPTPKGKRKAKPASAPGSRSPKKAKASQENGTWSSEVRSTIVKYIFDRGTEGLNYGDLAAMTGLSQGQLKNALQKGQKSNLRAKCIKYAEGL